MPSTTEVTLSFNLNKFVDQLRVLRELTEQFVIAFDAAIAELARIEETP